MDHHNEGLPRDRRLCFALHGCRWQEDSSQEGKKYREVNGARQGEGRHVGTAPVCPMQR